MINKAIAFAMMAHGGQFRKGTQLPYILHPMEVGMIVSRMTNDIEIIAAAILSCVSYFAVYCFMVDIIRYIDGTTMLMITIYGIEATFIPQILAILIGKPGIMYGMCVVYLLLDIVSIIAGRGIVRELVDNRWFCDRK